MTAQGTTLSDLADCARSYGFRAEAVSEAAWSDLLHWLADGLYPVLAVNLYPLELRWAAHTVVVEVATDTTVAYLDPQFGPRRAERAPFEQAWAMRFYRAVLIGPAK